MKNHKIILETNRYILRHQISFLQHEALLCQRNRLRLYFYPKIILVRAIRSGRSGPWISDTNHSLMSICISDLSSLSHHILQISPAENRKLNLERTDEDEHVTQIVPFNHLSYYSQSIPSGITPSTDIEGPNRD